MERYVEVGLILGLLWIWSRYYQRACRAAISRQAGLHEEAADLSAPEDSQSGRKVHETVEPLN